MSTHYLKYALNLLISLVIMYLVMFTMIDGINDFYNNPNMFYMAIMMVAPMAMLMLLMMAPMYPKEVEPRPPPRLRHSLHRSFHLHAHADLRR